MDQASRLKKTRKSRFQNVIALACLFVCVPIALGVQRSEEDEHDRQVLKSFIAGQVNKPVITLNEPTPSYCGSNPKINPKIVDTKSRIEDCDAGESKALEMSFEKCRRGIKRNSFEKTRDNPLDPNKFDLVECIDDLIAFGTLETPKKLVRTLEHLEYVLEKSELRSDKKSELKDIVAKILVFRPAPKKTEANRDVCEKFLSAYNKLLEFFDDVYAARQRANVNTKDDDTFDFLRKQTGAADKVIRVKKCKSYVTNHSTKEDLEKVKKNYMLVKAMFPEHVFIDGRYAIIDQEFAEMIKAAPDPAQGVRRKSKAYDKQSASESRKTFVDILNSKSISDRLNEELWGERTQSGNNESQIMNYLQLVNLMQVRFYTAKDLFPPLSVVGEDEGDAGVQAPLQRLFAGIDF